MIGAVGRSQHGPVPRVQRRVGVWANPQVLAACRSHGVLQRVTGGAGPRRVAVTDARIADAVQRAVERGRAAGRCRGKEERHGKENGGDTHCEGGKKQHQATSKFSAVFVRVLTVFRILRSLSPGHSKSKGNAFHGVKGDLRMHKSVPESVDEHRGAWQPRMG